MLTQKAKELGLSNTKYYVDDGYTGTNFNRPAFQELLDDIEMGYISVVIVKDLSRLGRDYVSVGHYTDNYFPEHNVRFIAVKHSEKSWLVRTGEKIYPWNFENVVDADNSAEKFINNLTSKCTYLPKEDVIPKFKLKVIRFESSVIS